MAEPPNDPEWHRSVIEQFRSRGGTVDYYGRVLVLLHNRGRRSGIDRVVPVAAIPDGDDWLIAASRRGHADDPAWLANLRAHPDVEIETPDEGTVAVRAAELPRDERDAAWERFTSLSPRFAEYQAGTERIIPVLRLTRR